MPATAQPTPQPPPTPVDVLVSVEGTGCPNGGPIFKWVGGKLSTLVQGGVLKKPRDGKLDGRGNLIMADGGGAGLLRVNLSTGAVSVIAVGPPYQPRDVVIEPSGNFVVVDWPEGIHPEVGPALYRITPAGQVTAIARGAPLTGPHGLDIDAQGNFIVSDVKGGMVIRVTPQGQMTVIVARGTAGFVYGSDVVIDRDGSYVVADAMGTLWRVTPSGQISAIHRGAPFTTQVVELIGGPRSVVIDPAGNYVVVDAQSATIYQVTRSGAVFPMLKDAALCQPAGVILLQ